MSSVARGRKQQKSCGECLTGAVWPLQDAEAAQGTLLHLLLSHWSVRVSLKLDSAVGLYWDGLTGAAGAE